MNVTNTRSSSVQSTQRPTQIQQTRQQEQTTPAQPEQAAAAKPAEQPKPTPVVNTQGQTTGRLLNTSA
jgi:hypothetical protein